MQREFTRSRTSLIDLYNLADRSDITILSADCPKCKAISLLSPQGRLYIGIDYTSMQSEREERQYLAHDIGHCIKVAFYNPYSSFNVVSQQEYRADKAAVRILVPLMELKKALRKGYTELWQLADYFDVDEKYIKLAYWEYFDIRL